MHRVFENRRTSPSTREATMTNVTFHKNENSKILKQIFGSDQITNSVVPYLIIIYGRNYILLYGGVLHGISKLVGCSSRILWTILTCWVSFLCIPTNDSNCMSKFISQATLKCPSLTQFSRNWLFWYFGKVIRIHFLIF